MKQYHGELFTTSLPQPLGSPGPFASIVGLIAFATCYGNKIKLSKMKLKK